jgi:hypothetical protein
MAQASDQNCSFHDEGQLTRGAHRGQTLPAEEEGLIGNPAGGGTMPSTMSFVR